MTKKDLKLFLDHMSKAVLEAGQLAKSMQGKVKNIGKHIDHVKEGTENIKEVAEAKTVIDEQVQEILLKAAAECLDTKSVAVDGEEKTPSLSLFPNKNSDMVLVLDPIDGTLLYLNGKDTYCNVVGLINKGKVISALVYFPVKDTLYFLDNNKKGRMAENFSKIGFKKARLLKRGRLKNRKVFVSYTVPKYMSNNMKKRGFNVVRDIEDIKETHWMMRCLDLLCGEYSMLILKSPQIRDILLGPIVGTVKGVYVVDWQGKPLVWPSGGRVAKVIFGVGKIPKDIIACLKS